MPKQGFGFDEPEENDLENDHEIAPLDLDELSKMDSMMGDGLSGNAFQRHGTGNAYHPENLKKGGIQEHLSGKKNPGEITEEELQAFMEEFEQDPHGQTKKQLYRMMLAEKRHINDLYTMLSDVKVGSRQAGDIHKMIKETTENMLNISEALRLQPKQNKDDNDGNNVATISEMWEEHRRRRKQELDAEAQRDGRDRPEDDQYGLNEMDYRQRRKIWQQANPDKQLPPELLPEIEAALEKPAEE